MPDTANVSAKGSPHTVRSSFFSSAVIALLIRLGSAALSFASMVMISRWLGAEVYGDFAVMLTLGSFMGLAATIGLPTLTLRVIPQITAAAGAGAGAEPKIRAFVRTTYGAMLVTGIGTCLLMALASYLLDNTLILFAASLVLPFAYAEHQAHVLRSLGRISSALLPRDILWYAMMTVLGAAGSAVLGWQPLAGGAIGAVAGGLLLLMLAQWHTVHNALKAPGALQPKKIKPVGITTEASSEIEVGATSQEAPFRIAWTSEVFFLWLSTMSNAIQRHLSVVVAAPFLTVVETGAFFAAHRTALMLSLPLIAANLVAAPLIARAWAEGNPNRVQRLCKLISLCASLPALVGLGLIYFGGEMLLGLFDPAFQDAQGALYVFGFAFLINALCGPTGYVMLMTGNERPFVLIQLTSQLIGMICMAFGAANFGLTGAAIGAAIGTVGWNFAVWYWCQTRLDINPTITAWLRR